MQCSVIYTYFSVVCQWVFNDDEDDDDGNDVIKSNKIGTPQSTMSN